MSLQGSHHKRVLFIDLNNFKKINDEYGHDVGDQTIRQVANLLSGVSRASDTVVRFGGEEFLVMLTDTTGDSALIVAEKLRKLIESSPVQFNNISINITISIGVSRFHSSFETIDDQIKFADHALYQAKDEGRNKIIAAA